MAPPSRSDGNRLALRADRTDPATSLRINQASVILDELRDAQARACRAALEATRIKSDFLANISHELRTPLSAVLGFIDLTLDTELTAHQSELLDRARSAARNMLALIINLLDCAKLESRTLEVEATPFSLRRTLRDALAIAALRAHHNGVELCCDVRPDVPDSLVGQPTRLGQVLMNLLDNATKFTEVGEILLRVSVDSDRSRDDTLLHFAISDTGIGIPSDKHGLIFEPFVQVDGSMRHQYAGVGLGLTIARQVVELMGGTIWLESALGKGTTFHFTLRVGVVRPARATGAPFARTAVLIADDHGTTRRLLVETARRWGMAPTVAEDGPQTLAALTTGAPDGRPFAVALIDADMQDDDGTSLVDAIVREGRPETSVILLTSPHYRGDVVQYRGLRVAGYLSKPVIDSVLHEVLEAVLSQAPRTRRSEAAAGRKHRVASRPLRILLAEDDPAHQELTVRLLERRGHEVLTARNGREALSTLATERVDLLLLDLQMPELDGLTTARTVRAREAGHDTHLPIVALTAHVMEHDRDRCLRAGMDGYVPKPVEPTVLFTTIERVTRRARRSSHVPRLERNVVP